MKISGGLLLGSLLDALISGWIDSAIKCRVRFFSNLKNHLRANFGGLNFSASE
jgi:hypothetical protein